MTPTTNSDAARIALRTAPSATAVKERIAMTRVGPRPSLDTMTALDVIDLAWSQIGEYVARAPRMSRDDQRAVRDALANAVADMHAAGVRL